jgi:hypothetical protein
MAFQMAAIDLGIRDEDGNRVYSAVLSETDFADDPGKGKVPAGKNQTLAIEALEKLIIDYIPLPGSPAGVPLGLWRDKCSSVFGNKTRFYEIKKSLLRRGKIRIEEDYVSFL